MMGLRRVRWAVTVACLSEMRNAYTVLLEKPTKNDDQEDLAIYERVMIKWIL
jgi:hypothetical protein